MDDHKICQTNHHPTNIAAAAASTASCAISHSNDPGSLFPLLKKIIPHAQSYKNLSSISQGNAEGARILVDHPNHNGNTNNDTIVTQNQVNEQEKCLKVDEQPPSTTELFVKHIQASNYSHKSWADLRRTLVYGRTEARFYKDILPWMESKGYLQNFPNLAPKCHFVEYDLDGLLEEEEHAVLDATAPSNQDTTTTNQRMVIAKSDPNKGATFILDSICSKKYFQDSPLSPLHVKKCLSTVAKLHACAWEEQEILHVAQARLSVTSYHLPFRNPKELENIEESWNQFTAAFATTTTSAQELFAKPSIQMLGKRVKDMAQFVSTQLSPTATDKYATLVHGDYKSMNVFLPVCDDDDAIMIDFASVGVGFGMCDIAMHITHALHPKHFKDGQEERFVEYYLKELEKAVVKKTSSQEAEKEQQQFFAYPRDVAFRHYKLAVIDYFRFVLGRFWSSATPESFEAKKDTKNRTLPNRNVESAFAFIERVDRYLVDFENEFYDKAGQ